jgi:hypothetical protein
LETAQVARPFLTPRLKHGPSYSAERPIELSE